MRNLKKALALVLALMMALSLMVTASASDYADGSKITKTEAVEVMSMINVFQGDNTGNFDPTGNLTRAQAAKIISYMKLGEAVAEVLPKDEAPFPDVKADRWYTGYVAYAKSEGIIDGRANGNFDPNATLTGYEFGKMVLEAAGIKGEYTGSNWKLNINTALRGGNPAKKNLLAGLEIVLNDPISREDACQLAFNGLNYTVSGATTGKWVVYNKGDVAALYPNLEKQTFDSYIEAMMVVNAMNISAEVEVEGEDGETTTVTMKATLGTNYEIKAQEDTTGSLGHSIFSLVPDYDAHTAFGAPAVKWTSGKKSVTVADEPTLSYDKKVTGKTIWADLGEVAGKASVKEDGAAATDLTLSKESTESVGSGNGSKVDVYYDGTDVEIVVVNTYLSTITKHTDANGDDKESINVALAGDATAKFETDKFTKEDVNSAVLYTATKKADGTINAIQNVWVPAEASGTVTRTSGTGAAQTFVMGGETYKWSAKAVTPGLAAGYIGKEIAVYLDDSGNVIGLKTDVEEAQANYAVVVATREIKGDWNGASTYQVKLLLTSGETADKTVAKVDGVAANGDNVKNDICGTIFTYVEKDGGIEMTTVSGDNLKTISTGTTVTDSEGNSTFVPGKIERNKPNLTDGAVANKDTVFLFTSADGKTLTTYTGIGSVPSTQVAMKADKTGVVEGASDFQIAVDDDGIAKVVYVTRSEAIVNDVTSNDVIFVIGGGALSADERGEYKEYAAVINGEITTLVAAKDTDMGAAGGILLKSVTEDANGRVTGKTAMGAADGALDNAALTGISAPAGGNIKIGTAFYVYGENTKVYSVDGDEISEISVDSIVKNDTAKVFGYTGADGVLAALFIVG